MGTPDHSSKDHKGHANPRTAAPESRIRELESQLQAECQQNENPSQALRWPLTRGQRMKELDQLLSDYKSTHQLENILAARTYHSQFPAHGYIPLAVISFMEGKIVDESWDIYALRGPAWSDVCQNIRI